MEIPRWDKERGSGQRGWVEGRGEIRSNTNNIDLIPSILHGMYFHGCECGFLGGWEGKWVEKVHGAD